MAVRLAVPKLTADDVAALEREIDEMSACGASGDVQGFFEANTAFHLVFFDAAGNRMLADLYRHLRAQIDRHRLRSLELRGDVQPLDRRAQGDPPRGEGGRRGAGGPSRVRAHPRAADPTARRGPLEPRRRPADERHASVRRQSQQPGAADRSRLRPPDAARPLRGGRGVRLRLRVGGRQPLLEAPLRADRAAGGDLAAHDTGEARHGVHGVVDAEPALSRARVGDARPDLGRPHDLRHGDGEPGGGCSARVRGARPRLRAARRALRRRPRRAARALDDGRGDVQGPLLRLRGRRLLLGDRDGPAAARCSSRRRSGSSPTRG